MCVLYWYKYQSEIMKGLEYLVGNFASDPFDGNGTVIQEVSVQLGPKSHLFYGHDSYSFPISVL